MFGAMALSASSAAQPPAGAPYPRPPGAHEVTIERNVMVPMRDGVRLATDLYRPKDVAGPLPTVLMRTPYNKAANPNGDASARARSLPRSSITRGTLLRFHRRQVGTSAEWAGDVSSGGR
jgi:predicted acyl esterase